MILVLKLTLNLKSLVKVQKKQCKPRKKSISPWSSELPITSRERTYAGVDQGGGGGGGGGWPFEKKFVNYF